MQTNILPTSEITQEALWLHVIYECADRMGIDLPLLEGIPLAVGEDNQYVAQALTLLRLLDICQLRNLYLQLVQYDDTRTSVGTFSREVLVTLLWRLVKYDDIRSHARPPAGPP